jgi:hypothetical protein
MIARVLAVAAIALGAQSTPSHADGFSLNLATQSEAVVGRPLVVQATGTVPRTQPGDIVLPYWYTLVAIPTSVTTTCPVDRYAGAQMANATGSVIALSLPEVPDAAGSFQIPSAARVIAPGTVLLCGYTHDGADVTLARAQLSLNIKPAASSRARARCQRLRSRRARARCRRAAR